MSSTPEPGVGAPPDQNRAVAESPLIAQVQQITAQTYTATSPDGHVTVTVGGDQRLREVSIHDPDAPAGLIGRAATTATNEALSTARRATVSAMRDLPGLPSEMRRLLGGQ